MGSDSTQEQGYLEDARRECDGKKRMRPVRSHFIVLRRAPAMPKNVAARRQPKTKRGGWVADSECEPWQWLERRGGHFEGGVLP